MHPTIAAALAAERHTELLRIAESHRKARLARAPRLAHPPTSRPAHARLADAAIETIQRLQLHVSQLTPLGSARRSTVRRCCA